MATEYQDLPKESAAEIERDLFSRLPELAQKIISPKRQNDNFRLNPDDPLEHSPNWHEFGIVTHSKRVSETYQTEAQNFLQQWQIKDNIDQTLAGEIDGRSKAELLQISIPLHDIGKFASDLIKRGERLHPGHEALGKKIILTDETIRSSLASHGLTEKQIQYIADCVGLHYELGTLREKAKSQPAGFSISWAESADCRQACEDLAKNYPDLKTEIGLWFLCDSLAKTDIRLAAQTDEEIENQSPAAAEIIKEKNLNPKLIAAVKQLPVNVACAKTYLQTISRE